MMNGTEKARRRVERIKARHAAIAAVGPRVNEPDALARLLTAVNTVLSHAKPAHVRITGKHEVPTDDLQDLAECVDEMESDRRREITEDIRKRCDAIRPF